MREPVNVERLERFMQALAAEAVEGASVFLTGGATAVLLGWRATTIDADLIIVPDDDRLFRALPRLKEALHLNVEIASPAHFIPELAGWRERSLFIARKGHVTFYHYDPYAQTLAKIERAHAKDLADVAEFLRRGLVKPARLRELFAAMEPHLYRYPAIDPPSFRRRLDEVLASLARG